MRGSKRAARLAAVAGAVVTGLVMASTPAWAVEQTVGMGSIKMGHGGVIRDGYLMYACDDRADGEGVRTEVRLNSGDTTHVTDANGSKAGCTQAPTPGQYYAQTYRVCSGPACTGWAPAF
jgi:hypothetical protein